VKKEVLQHKEIRVYLHGILNNYVQCLISLQKNDTHVEKQTQTCKEANTNNHKQLTNVRILWVQQESS
jgi:hypothetical protein